MIFDAEADGLLGFVTKVHVLAYEKPDGKIGHTHDYFEMREILTKAKLLIGHNIICYDLPMLERILGIKITARLIDTLPLSWYLNHKRNVHGLDSFGKDFGIPKPKIDNWENLSPEEYAHRCIEDVKINRALWKDLRGRLIDLYGSKKEAGRFIDYLSFKMDCLREQESSKWKLDIELAQKSLDELLEQQDEKIPQLIEAMPKVVKTTERTKPAKPYKKDGTLSVAGAKWFALLKERGLPDTHTEPVEVVVGEVEANPNSHDQIKNWLYSLGWVPTSFNYVRDKDTGDERKIPQVRVDGDEGKELCPSVRKLIPDNPALEVLEGLTIIQHRISIFEGFLKNHQDGWLTAGAGGLTNTLRFKHRVLVNLPGVGKPWGEQIRGSLVAPEGYLLCGSDMMSLESNTKRHYMYPYDPDYVNEMSKEGFDEHLDLAKLAKEVTQEQIDLYNQGKAPELKPVRGKFKPANYAGIYGVKEKTLSRQTGMSEKACAELLDLYWKRNWSVKVVAENTKVKFLGNEMWLYNPVSRFWYSLRYKKDIFSTLNQGTGVYCFDKWIMAFREKRKQLTGQFHDEVILCIKEGAEDKCTKLLKEAIAQVNDELKLNVKLDVDIQYGKTYAEIH